MNNKILKDLIKRLISECNYQIKDIENDIKITNNSNNIKNINLIKNNINNIKDISNEDIKDILNDLNYKNYSERLDIERYILEIKNSINNNISLSDTQYEYINNLYNKIDYYLEHNSKDNNKMINDLRDMISMYNSLINKLSMINSEYIDEVEVVDLVLKNSDFNYYIKKDILRDIMNYNRDLYLKNY